MDIKFNVQLSDYKEQWLKDKYLVLDDILDNEQALEIQTEILSIPYNRWDRYENPFEQKNTLRDKHNLPIQTTELFKYLNCPYFLDQLTKLSGYEILEDKSRNWWGIHIFNHNDKLDIHVDAGRHPVNGLKKLITLGIYFSYHWSSSNGGNIEFWKGTNASDNNAILDSCIVSIEPKFNRLILFECNDYSWHGAPEPCKYFNDEQRIFLTCSYLADIPQDTPHLTNNRKKAFFIAKPNEPLDIEKQTLRLLRCDENKYKDIYKYHYNNNNNNK